MTILKRLENYNVTTIAEIMHMSGQEQKLTSKMKILMLG